MRDPLAFVEDRPGLPASEQRAKALELGVPESKIYQIGKGGVEKFEHFVQAVRKGSTIYVGGFHVLARERAEMSARMKTIGDKGATLVDWNNPDPFVALDQAYLKLRGMKSMPSPEEASRRGKAGAKVRWKNSRIPLTEKHKAMWRDAKKYARDDDAAAAISEDFDPPVTAGQLRYRLKSSGRPMGRRAAKKRKR